MKKIIVMLFAAFICSAFLVQNRAQAQAAVKPAMTQTQPANPGMKEEQKHPNILDAQKDLKNAETHLSQAPKEFGGHKAKAMELIKQAETELKAGLDWAKAHGE